MASGTVFTKSAIMIRNTAPTTTVMRTFTVAGNKIGEPSVSGCTALLIQNLVDSFVANNNTLGYGAASGVVMSGFNNQSVANSGTIFHFNVFQSGDIFGSTGNITLSGVTAIRQLSGLNWTGAFTSGGVSGGSGASYSGMIPQGYLNIQISGSTVKIPFFN